MDFISADLEDETISYNTSKHMLKCNRCIMNLIVCEFYFIKHSDGKKYTKKLIKFQMDKSVQEENF